MEYSHGVFIRRFTLPEDVEDRTMLRSINSFLGYIIAAEDDEVGMCHDFLFEDRPWIVRYMVTDIVKWIVDRQENQKVLISPIALGDPDWETLRFPVKLTRQQIEDSPPLDEDAPVSRKYEIEISNYHTWPYYWDEETPNDIGFENGPEMSHLRSVKEVTGYDIQASDGGVGHVEDFIVDDRTWAIRYAVVNTSSWLPERKVLVAPTWMESVSWAERKVHVDLTVKAIRKSPVYDPYRPINRDYEGQLYDYYGRPYYWE